MKPAPFSIKRENGIVWVDTAHDAAFRKALMDGVPPSLRGKMREALAATPQKNAAAHSRRYFGAEADKIFADAAELASVLHRFLQQRFGLDGLLDWLDATGFGNDYRMIKVFAEWARLTPGDDGKLKLIVAAPEQASAGEPSANGAKRNG